MYYVYVLRSKKSGYRYIGHTNDIESRLKEHNLGLTKSIRFQTPFELEYTESYPTRLEAIRREKHLKTGQGRGWLNEIKDKKTG